MFALIAPSAMCCGLIASFFILLASTTPLPIKVFAFLIPVPSLLEDIVPVAILASVTAPVLIVLVTILPDAIAC